MEQDLFSIGKTFPQVNCQSSTPPPDWGAYKIGWLTNPRKKCRHKQKERESKQKTTRTSRQKQLYLQ